MTSMMNATGSPVSISPAQIAMLLPNPFTPMAFLPPATASQVTVSTYVLIGATAILVWDVLTHLMDDYRLLSRHRFNFSMGVYFVSRLFNILCLVGYTVLNTAPLGHCNVASKVADAFLVLAVPTSELLLFLHVRAVYINNKYVVWTFTLMWLSTFGGALTPMIAPPAVEIGITKYCIGTGLPSYAAASIVIPMVNDSILFGALVWRMLHSSHANRNVKNDIQTMVFGDYIPQVSKALLQNGQAYFLTAVGFNLLTLILYFSSSLPLAYRSISGFPNIMLMNVMASRLYRNTKFGNFNVAPMRKASAVLASKAGEPSMAISLGQLGEQATMDSSQFDENSEHEATRVMVHSHIEKFDLESSPKSFGTTVV